MQAVVEKELPDREIWNIVRDIIKMFRDKGISFNQAEWVLDTALKEIRKLPLTE